MCPLLEVSGARVLTTEECESGEFHRGDAEARRKTWRKIEIKI